MKREIFKVLMAWKQASDRKPILLRGARQVGKTYIINALGDTFSSYVSINLEQEHKIRRCFDSLSPEDIVDHIALLKQKQIIPGKTLLFIDEIQAYPKAIESLRYFREQMPELHVIAAGSLLEFVLHQEHISMPVGRINYLYMQPCSYNEFLSTLTHDDSLQELSQCSLSQPLSQIKHDYFLDVFKTYMVVGGMPEAVATYQSTKQIYDVQQVQRSILQTYRDDFGKYSSQSNLHYLQVVFDKAPGLIGTQIKYHKIDAELRSRVLKQAIQMLEYAGVVKKVLSTTASGLPLKSTINDKKFKLQFLDVGLVQCAMEIGPNINWEDIRQLNDGALAEQVVGQQLLAYADPYLMPQLYFWARDAKGSSAEVDFVMNLNGSIMPIEVKFGAHGHLKSLYLFLKEKQMHCGIKISSAPLSFEQNILNIPFYLIGELPRLYQEVLSIRIPPQDTND